MKFVNNILYITFQELECCGIPRRTLSRWDKIPDPLDNRIKLYDYEQLKPSHKSLITTKYGNPYTFAGQYQVKNHIKTDHEALKTLTFFKFDTGKGLSNDQINDLSKACDVLNFLSKMDKSTVKTLGFDGMPSFYNTIIAYLNQEKISLPTSYSRLREAVREYAATGAKSVISGRFGNQNNRKIKNEVSLALLQKLIAHPHRFGDVIVCMKYNEEAAKHCWPTISEATVGNYRRTHEKELMLNSEGTAAWRNKFDKVVHRMRPSAPLLLINSDDNNLDLYFRTDKTSYYRPVIYVVIDAFNDYPLGYAIGNVVTIELIREAYRNAANHVRELTGNHYLWQQIVTDRWGLDVKMEGELATFFKQQARFTPAKYSNARNKVIEASFGNNWHNALKFYNNYAGHNVTAKNTLNREASELTKKDWPGIEEMPTQVAHFIHTLRTQINPKTGTSKQAAWLECWNSMALEMRRAITKEEHLLYFGQAHTHTSRITNRGIEFKIKGHTHIYDVADADYERFVGLTGQITYDPQDLNVIMFSAEDGRVRILAHAYEKVPMALADFGEGDRTNLNRKLESKKAFSQKMLDSNLNRDEILQRAQIDAGSMLQAGVIKKEIRVAAERKLIQTDNPETTGTFDAEDYLLDQL